MNSQYLNLLGCIVVPAAAAALICLGKTCAETVWARAKNDLEADPLALSVTVPMATSAEAILIFLAVMLRSPYMLLLAVYRELRYESWERTQAIRQIDFNLRSSNDTLGAVSSMLSGYPERALPFFLAQRGKAIARQYQAYLEDHEAIG